MPCVLLAVCRGGEFQLVIQAVHVQDCAEDVYLNGSTLQVAFCEGERKSFYCRCDMG